MVVLSWIHYLIRIDWVEETYNLNDWIESKKNSNYDLIKNYTEALLYPTINIVELV